MPLAESGSCLFLVSVPAEKGTHVGLPGEKGTHVGVLGGEGKAGLGGAKAAKRRGHVASRREQGLGLNKAN